MKKVLFVATVESHILNFHIPYIKYFIDNGYEVHIAAKMSDRISEFDKLNVKLHDIPFSRSMNPFGNIKAYFQVKKLIKQEKFSLIHVHTPVAAFIVRYVAKKLKKYYEKSGTDCKVLYTAHGFHFYNGAPIKNKIIYYNAEKIAAKWTDALITINKEDYSAAKKFKFKPDGRTYYVKGVGLDINYYKKSDINITEYRHKLGISDNDIVILTAAELIKRKNYKQEIDAIKLIAQDTKIKNSIKYLIAGDGVLENKLKKYVEDNNLSDYILFLGFKNDMPNIFNICDVFLLTSLHEGLPRCIMEAMACSKPVVTTDVRGNHDLVSDKINGFLVKCNDIEDTKDKLEKLILNKQLRIEMGNEGRKIIEEYSIENVMKQIKGIYEECLNKENITQSNYKVQNTISG